jgi:competence protein ComEC
MNKFIAYTLLLLFSANVGLWWNIVNKINVTWQNSAIHFLDVGQGDAQLLETPAGNVLIDAGRSGGRIIQELDSILPLSDRIIDIAVITHPQLDHLGGFLEILKRYDVRLVVYTGVAYQLPVYESLLKEFRERRLPVLYALRGEEIKLGEGTLAILSPDILLKGVTVSPDDINDTSIVMYYKENDVSALFTGDISAKVERKLAKRIAGADILKVSHHGSKYSSDPEFLAAVRPKIAVIEVGKNPYGHPTAEVLLRLKKVGARVFRTDLDGTITLKIQNSKVKIQNSK